MNYEKSQNLDYIVYELTKNGKRFSIGNIIRNTRKKINSKEIISVIFASGVNIICFCCT